MSLELMLAWWNLIYIVPFLLALFYLGLFVFTGITFGDTDAGFDTDADADVDADATVHVEAHVVDVDVDADVDVDVDHDVDTDHDVEGDHDAGAQVNGHAGHGLHAAAIMPHTAGPHAGAGGFVDGHGEPSFFMSFLSILGVGKIPLSLALMILLLTWGVAGFALNALLMKWLAASGLVILLSLPVTIVVSLVVTGACAAIIGKLIPNDGPHEWKRDFVGRAGEAIYDIDATFGMASVRGNSGDFFQVPCRTATGKPRIVKGTRVVLFDYDREKGVFEVAPFDA